MTILVAKLRLANEIALNHHHAGKSVLNTLIREISNDFGIAANTVNLLIGGGMTKDTPDESILEILLDIEREERYEQLRDAFIP